MRIGKVVGRLCLNDAYETLVGGRFLIVEVQDRFCLAGEKRKSVVPPFPELQRSFCEWCSRSRSACRHWLLPQRFRSQAGNRLLRSSLPRTRLSNNRPGARRIHPRHRIRGPGVRLMTRTKSRSG